MYFMFSNTLLTATAIAFIGEICLGASDDVQPSTARLAEMLLAGVRDGRERVRQGVVYGVAERSDGPMSSTRPASFFTAFDVDAEMFRFDYTRTARVRGRDGRNASTQAPRREANHQYIRLPDKSIQFGRITGENVPGEITIFGADEPLPPGFELYDARAIGLLTAGGFSRRWKLEEVFDRVYNALSPTEVADEGDGVYRLCATSRDGGYRYCLWVDRNRGFTPLRLEESARAVPAVPGRPNNWPWSTVFATSAAWARINDAWIPTRWSITDYSGGKTLWSCTYRLEWKCVNEPPSQQLFDIASFDAPKGTLVTNAVGQQPYIDHLVGVKQSPLDGALLRGRGTVRRVAWTTGQIALAIVAVALATTLLAIELRRRDRRKRNGGPQALS